MLSACGRGDFGMGPDELDPTDLPLLLVEDIVDTEDDADVAVAGVRLLPALPLVVTRLLLLFLLPVSCLLYTSPSPRDRTRSRMPSSA